MDDYKFYGYNRSFIKKTAKVASGGVGILLKYSIVSNNYIAITDITYEGILSLTLTNKITTKQVNITVCYLPPERSQYGRDTQGFYDHLLQLMYQVTECDSVVVGGDFNGRIGNKVDYIPDIDNITGRKPLDLDSNSHGEALFEFLKESKMGVINSCVTTQHDNYTSVSGRGKAVVDYLITPHTYLDHIVECSVHTVKDLCDSRSYNPDCKLPDH
jgi:hypothetical protein